MPLLDQFSDARCASIQQLANAKNYEDVLDIADSYWDDGSAGDCIYAIGEALVKGMRHGAGTPVWQFYLGETAVFFIGSEASVKAKINAL